MTSYVPKGNWGGGPVGVSAVNVEGSSVTPTLIATPSTANSCASNPATNQTVCVANNTEVYVISGTTLSPTLHSAGTGTMDFSGGTCTNCGVAMDGIHSKAVIALNFGPGNNVAGYQFLDLGTTPTFEPAFASGAPLVSSMANISEDILIDPIRGLILSPDETNNFELVNVKASTATPSFFENPTVTTSGDLDSAAEDCSTGIALAPAEFTSDVFLASLSLAHFTPGTPGTWTAPSQVQTLTGVSLSAGNSGMAVAQGTHIGALTGEFGGSSLVAFALPTSAAGTPQITDWVQCSISGFSMGFDPHTVTAYKSPNSHDAIALLVNGGATDMEVVDLTQMLNTTKVPRDAGGHTCSAGTLPSSVVTSIPVP